MVYDDQMYDSLHPWVMTNQQQCSFKKHGLLQCVSWPLIMLTLVWQTAIHRTLYTAAIDCNQQYTGLTDWSWFTSTAHNQAVNTNPKWRFETGIRTEVSCPTCGQNLGMINLKLRKMIYYLYGILAGTTKN